MHDAGCSRNASNANASPPALRAIKLCQELIALPTHAARAAASEAGQDGGWRASGTETRACAQGVKAAT